MLRPLLLFLHLAGVIVWVGGMFFAYFCLRPAALALEPNLRLPLWVAAFARFLRYAAVAVVLILTSGAALFLPAGGAAPVGWMIMASAGLAMACGFGYVYFGLYPRLRARVAAAQWPQAATELNAIRRLVGVNLILAACAMAGVAAAR